MIHAEPKQTASFLYGDWRTEEPISDCVKHKQERPCIVWDKREKGGGLPP